MKTKYIDNCMSIETEKIYKLIAWYQAEKGEKPKYLIMSNCTCDFLKAEYEKYFAVSLKNTSLGGGQYQGIDIAICNTLEFGQIECV